VKFQIWEIGVAVGALLLAGLLFAAGGVVQGVAFVLFAAVWVIARVDVIADVTSAGRAARFRARLGIARFVVLVIVYFAATAGLFVVAFSDEKSTTVGQIAAFALCGLTALLFLELRRTDDDTINWLKGSKAEENVGGELDKLREEGWMVIHGLPNDWGGDVDHIVCGPRGAYSIETKSGRFRRPDRHQATRNAVWVKKKLGVPWVTGVLCVGEDIPPTKHEYIWVMGHGYILDWIRAQRERPVSAADASERLTGSPGSHLRAG
jgi:hypothetical protein